MVYWVTRAYLFWEGIMSKRIFVPALLAAALSAAIPALAQDRSDQDRNDRNGVTQRDDRGDNRYQHDQRDSRYQNDRRDNHDQNDRHDNRRQDDRRNDRTQGNYGQTSNFNAGYDGYGPDHDLRRGGHLPGRYRNHQYVVNDWRSHHLHAPPRGQQWVQVGADYVLIAAATGLIVEAVSGQ